MLLPFIALALSDSSAPANDFYVSQRAPLAHSRFQKLPTGAIRGRGWLQTQLELQRDGFAGNLSQISRFLDPKDNAWTGSATTARAGWEELPYWLKGQVSLAYVLDDKKLKEECQPWIEGILASQREDGWMGPESNLKTKHGTPDLWPNCLAQNVLQTYYEATGDQRVLVVMRKYVDWLAALPEKDTYDPKHYWHYYRVGDQLASLVWIYNHTGHEPALKVAEKIHRAGARWDESIVNRHGVNFAQGFREPALYSLFSKSASDYAATERNLNSYMEDYGLPGGMYAADENARPGHDDPRQATESCSVAEMMYSGEQLFQTTGKTKWGDLVEEVCFNWLPTTMTADLKALRYLTCGNMAVSNAPGHSPGIENGGPMFLMDPHDHRCCQHNLGMAWPYFTEHLWFATEGNGLAAALYAPSEVTAKVGDGTKVIISTVTNYPFNESILMRVSPAKSVSFPLMLRVPAWCEAPLFILNGQAQEIKPTDGFVTLNRTWSVGDEVKIQFPMPIKTKVWEKHGGAVSVSRGPLTYSLKIDEEARPYGARHAWPASEIYAKSAWNYGLQDLDFTVSKSGSFPNQPWDANSVPITLHAEGRRIPEWGLDLYGLVAPLQQSPAQTAAPIERIQLIPMGAARLRITAFPMVAERGTVWTKGVEAATPLPATYSHRNWWDTEGALSDRIHPENAGGQEIPRFTWWDHKGTEEWVAYKFEETRTFQRVRVWFYDDSFKNGGCRMPASWKMQVKVGDKWEDIEATYPVVKDGWSAVTFRPTGGTEIRLVAKLQEGFSSGILEWEVE